MHKILKILLGVFIALIIIVLAGIVYFYFQLKSIQVKDEVKVVPSTSPIVSPTPEPIFLGKTSLLLVGVDTTNEDASARSDAMMLVTLDTTAKAIKLISFARDTYVYIPGYSQEKLTHAHAYGGVNLLKDTLKENFEIQMPYYVEIDFESFIVVIDLIGGVEVALTTEDLKEFNRVSKENYDIYYDDKIEDYISIKEDGTYILNGYQTLGYVRMRKGDNAFARDLRQREVVSKILQKMPEVSPVLYPKLLEGVLPYIRTNMSPAEIIKMGTTVLSVGTNDIRQLEFPLLEYSTGVLLPGKGWVLQWPRDICLEELRLFLE